MNPNDGSPVGSGSSEGLGGEHAAFDAWLRTYKPTDPARPSTALERDAAWLAWCARAALADAVQPQRITQGVRDVLAERHRQLAVEGYAPERDDRYKEQELAAAAACYALADRAEEISLMGLELAHDLWPWTWLDWKPSNHRRNLVKAAALLLAEIERLDRMKPPNAEVTGNARR